MSRRLLRLPEVKRMTSLGTSTIYRRMADGIFPKPIQLGGRMVAWLESDIEAWIDQAISQSSPKPVPVNVLERAAR